MLQLVDHPAAGIESGSTMFRSCSNEDDIVASFDCGDTMHDASIQQAESVESFFTQLAHLGQRHTTVGFEADLGGLHLPPNCTPPSPTTLASCCSQMCGVGHVAMKSRSQSDPIRSNRGNLTHSLIPLLLLILAANGAPVLARKLLASRYDYPLDFGFKLRNQDFPGESKTWRGLVASLVFTSALAGLLATHGKRVLWCHCVSWRATCFQVLSSGV